MRLDHGPRVPDLYGRCLTSVSGSAPLYDVTQQFFHHPTNLIMTMMVKLLLILTILSAATSFVPRTYNTLSQQHQQQQQQQQRHQPKHGGGVLHSTHPRSSSNMDSSTFEVTIDLPPKGSNMKARLNIESILSVPTELVVVRYQLPFGLNVEPVKGLAVVTQPGFGGERPGDILRFTTQWTLGLPSGESLANTFASFAGGLSWQCSIFDVIKAKAWEQVVNALTSNTMERTDEVVLIFERPVGGVIPPELQ
jgi:hypothetical protein